jgi:hypothetical protein
MLNREYFAYRLTFLVCSVGFTSPMLFDEKKMPYHLMLQKFLACGGQDAMFQLVLLSYTFLFSSFSKFTHFNRLKVLKGF